MIFSQILDVKKMEETILPCDFIYWYNQIAILCKKFDPWMIDYKKTCALVGITLLPFLFSLFLQYELEIRRIMSRREKARALLLELICR